MSACKPALDFFHDLPSTADDLVSSLQSVETMFLLIALGRYPPALLACASAIESVIATSSCKPNKNGLQGLIDAARSQSSRLGLMPRADIDKFRRLRNRITHQGFEEQDSNECAAALLSVAIPFLSMCLQELHSFDLMKMLLSECVDHFNVATEVYNKVRHEADDVMYCFRSFAHLIRWELKESFFPDWAIDAVYDADMSGVRFEHMHDLRNEIERLFEAYWDFKCPICGSLETAIAELKGEALDKGAAVPTRLFCINCELNVTERHLYLAETLLRNQIPAVLPEILRAYGIRK
jgi:hypothetical protein